MMERVQNMSNPNATGRGSGTFSFAADFANKGAGVTIPMVSPGWGLGAFPNSRGDIFFFGNHDGFAVKSHLNSPLQPHYQFPIVLRNKLP
jgi:hypothetical protein